MQAARIRLVAAFAQWRGALLGRRPLGKRLQSALERVPGVSVGGPAVAGPAIGERR